MRKVLVTGGAGFIGSHLCKKLVEMGHSVRTLDVSLPEAGFFPEKQVEFYRGSTLDINEVIRATQACDGVVHLAAMLGVARTEQQRLGCLNANILGTVNILEACVRDGVKKVVFASSSEVYGDQVGDAFAETSSVNPRTVYAVSKLAGEEFLRAYKDRYGLEYTLVRLFNVYGPGQRDEFVIPRFVSNVLNYVPPKVHGEGNQIRTFSYVSDVVDGITASLESPMANGEVINLGNPTEPISIRDLANRIIKIAGVNLKPVFVPYTEADRTQNREVTWRRPSIEKARSLLGYDPSVNLDAGIDLVLDWARKRAANAALLSNKT